MRLLQNGFGYTVQRAADANSNTQNRELELTARSMICTRRGATTLEGSPLEPR